MSKYIDKEKVLQYVKTYQAQLALGMIGREVDSGDLIKAINILPTIEVSEEVLKATKVFNAYTIADENAEMGMRTQIEPVIEVSEDCISRKDLRKKLQLYAQRSEMDNEVEFSLLKMIANAPSIVPQKHESGSNDNKISENNAVRPADDCIYTYCSRCGMRVVVNAPSVVPSRPEGEWVHGCCGECKHYKKCLIDGLGLNGSRVSEWTCCNSDSDYYMDYTGYTDGCEEWSERGIE